MTPAQDATTAVPHRPRRLGIVLAMLLLAHPIALFVGVAAITAAAVLHGWALLAPPLSWLVFGALAGGSDDLPGRAVRPADQPELAALVKQVAEDLGFRMPLAVRLVPTVDAGLVPFRSRGATAYALVLGWPLLRSMTRRELAAVVAHELAHEQHTRDRASRWLVLARDELTESLQGAVHVPRTLARPLLDATREHAWELELAADRDAARVVGGAAVRAALERTERLAVAYDELAEDWVEQLAEQDQYPADLYDAVEEALRDPLAVERVERIVREDGAVPQPPGASHPDTATRIAALPDDEDRDDDVRLPLHQKDELDRWCVHALVEEPDATPVSVLDRGHVTFAPPAELAYEALQDATRTSDPAAAMAATLDAIAQRRWQPVAGAVDPEVGAAPPELRPVAERGVLSSCLACALAGGLLDAGWQHASRWVAHALVSPAGEVVRVRDLVEDAIDSGRVEELQRLARAGGGTAA